MHVCGLISWASGCRSLLALRRSLGSCRTLRNPHDSEHPTPGLFPPTRRRGHIACLAHVATMSMTTIRDIVCAGCVERKAWLRSTLMLVAVNADALDFASLQDQEQARRRVSEPVAARRSLASLERHARRQSDFDFDDVSRPWLEAHSVCDALPEHDPPEESAYVADRDLSWLSSLEHVSVRCSRTCSDAPSRVGGRGASAASGEVLKGPTENEDEKRRGAISV